VLTFDAMAIQPSVRFVEADDDVIGLADVPLEDADAEDSDENDLGVDLDEENDVNGTGADNNGDVFSSTYQRGEGLANQMLVLMLRGTYARWKQPIGYVLSCHSLSPSRLMRIILQALHSAHAAGINVSGINYLGYFFILRELLKWRINRGGELFKVSHYFF
jgi:hypothetical protein